MVKPTFLNFAPYLIFSVSGLLCGVGISNFVLSHQFESLRLDNIKHQNRIQLLSEKLEEQTQYAGALGAEGHETVAQMHQPAPMMETPQKQASSPPPERKKPKPPEAQRPEAQRPAPRNIEPAWRDEPTKEIAAPKPKIQAEEPRHATPPPVEGKKIEALSIKKAGVLKIDRGSVTLENGTRIKLGDRFPSGEKLIFVDAANQHIITDKRQLLLLN